VRILLNQAEPPRARLEAAANLIGGLDDMTAGVIRDGLRRDGDRAIPAVLAILRPFAPQGIDLLAVFLGLPNTWRAEEAADPSLRRVYEVEIRRAKIWTALWVRETYERSAALVAMMLRMLDRGFRWIADLDPPQESATRDRESPIGAVGPPGPVMSQPIACMAPPARLSLVSFITEGRAASRTCLAGVLSQ
jgi:hypothetical protein